MRVEQLLKLFDRDVDAVIIVYENGYEEEFNMWKVDDEEYVNGIRFESFDIYEQDGCRILKVWM